MSYCNLAQALNRINSTMIDFRYNHKTGNYSVLRLNANPNMVFYKDGIARLTSYEEIERQLAALDN